MVSIIIPTYNRATLIIDTLKSIELQSYKNWECIVIDDHSDDNTEYIVKDFIKDKKRFQFHKRPISMKKGANSCRNFGFQKSQGEFIQWFDSDDLMSLNFLKIKMNTFKANPNINYNICGFSLFNKNGILRTYISDIEPTNILYNYAKRNIKLNTPSIMFKRPLVLPYSFNPWLSRAQDLDFIFNVLTSGKAKGIIIKQSLTKVRIHENSISARYKKNKKIDLKSSLYVCNNFFHFFRKEGNKEGQKLAKQDYILTLKNALKGNFFLFFFRKLANTNILTNSEKIKLLFLAFIYTISGKGITRMKLLAK
jgi:glycosyltransferase involved in cell wall biosynthesis